MVVLNLKDTIFSGDTLTVKYMGYESFSVPVSFGKNDSLFIKVSLQPLVLPMPEVSVAASRFNLERQLMALDPSAMHFTPADLEKLPSVAFADVYRALQKQPGITMTSEASPQIHIRGGKHGPKPRPAGRRPDLLPLSFSRHQFQF